MKKGSGTLGFPEKLGYAGISIADNLRTSFFSTFILFFGTNVLGIRPGLMSSLLSVSIVWDAINDPLIASYADNHPDRNGDRARQYLFASIPMGAILMLMFTRISDSVAACAVIILVLNLLYSVCTTMHRLPFYALMILVSPKEEDRISVNKYHFFGTGIGTALGAVAMWPLVRLFGGVDAEGNLVHSERGFFCGAAIVAAVIILFSVYHYFTTKERVRPQKEEQTPLLEAFKILFKNSEFRRNVIMDFFRSATLTAVTSYALYYASYVIRKPGMLTPLYAAYLVANMIIIPLLHRFLKRFGRRRSMIIAACGLIIGELVFVFLARNLAAGFVLVLCAGFATSVYNLVLSLDRASIADEVEVTEGRRVDSMVSNVCGFATKCGGALITLLFGWVLDFTHYDGNLSVQPESAVNGIIFIMGWCVILFCIGIILAAPRKEAAPSEKSGEK
ncbi:MAG: MFS transporter [Lachnospiraceae bacterium]|nr:MFS transporter [Lachnospiraceae bacterium]